MIGQPSGVEVFEDPIDSRVKPTGNQILQKASLKVMPKRRKDMPPCILSLHFRLRVKGVEAAWGIWGKPE